MLAFATTFPKLLSTAAFTCLIVLGPPRIHVTEATSRDNAPAGTVLLVEAHHHSDSEPLTVTGRAESVQNGRRVSLPLTLSTVSGGRYGVTRQWTSGSAWLLILTAGQGDKGAHGIAEALVKINAAGKIVGIEHPAAGWIGTSDTPKRISSAEIDAALASISAR
jgi:hypothetical protein